MPGKQPYAAAGRTGTSEHYPELTGTVITKLVRCSRPNCAACAAGYFHGPNAYYQYYEDGQLKEKYLGKKVREEYIWKTEANKKYDAVAAEIRTLEEEIAQLEALLPQKGREKG